MRELVAGGTSGPVVVLDEGLSFWGGFDPLTGRIVDRSHPQFGRRLTGALVCMPHGRGSSSSSSVLAESLRLGTGPAGLILSEPDQILVIGSLVAKMLYDVSCPIWVADPSEWPSEGEEVREA